MSQHFPALIVIIPLISAFIITAAGWLNKKLCFPIALAALAGSLACSVMLLGLVPQHGVIEYRLGGWPPPWGIAYDVDGLNGLVLVAVGAVAVLNLIATRKSAFEEFPDKIGPFYTLYVLFVTGLSGMAVTGDAFNLYVLLEIASLTGYALIGIGKGRAPLAGLNYVLMGTIGASFYLLGVGYLYIVTGTLNMADLARLLPEVQQSRVTLFAFGLCMTGLFVKMAVFPLHAWLPNAYSRAPSAAASLIAPLTTKVMIYVMIRLAFSVFTPEYAFGTLDVSDALVWLAAAAILAGSVMALSRKRLKMILSYIIVAEVGYMVGGFWLGNRAGMTGAILHIINDAAMTLCVFLAAGSFLYRLGSDALEDLAGVFRKMPFTAAAFVVGGLSIIGVPPTCGFFSKWYLISGAFTAGHYGFAAALIFSSLVNVILFFKIIEIGYFEPFTDHHHLHDAPAMAEAPLEMLMPLLAAAAGLILLGLYSGDIVTRIIAFAIPASI